MSHAAKLFGLLIKRASEMPAYLDIAEEVMVCLGNLQVFGDFSIGD